MDNMVAGGGFVGEREVACLQFVAHTVHLLHVREDHLRVDSFVSHHSFHVLSC